MRGSHIKQIITLKIESHYCLGSIPLIQTLTTLVLKSLQFDEILLRIVGNGERSKRTYDDVVDQMENTGPEDMSNNNASEVGDVNTEKWASYADE